MLFDGVMLVCTVYTRAGRDGGNAQQSPRHRMMFYLCWALVEVASDTKEVEAVDHRVT